MPGYSNAMFNKAMREAMGAASVGGAAGAVSGLFGTAIKPPSLPRMQFQAGFDNSALMQDPKFRQMATINQGMEVSEPYVEANKQAFSKNNPMNAISQETPVGDRVDEFLKMMGR